MLGYTGIYDDWLLLFLLLPADSTQISRLKKRVSFAAEHSSYRDWTKIV